MRVSLNWISDYLDTPCDPAEAVARWTAAGFPEDGRDDLPGDTVIDAEVTSNRPDCLSHVGLARELTAALGTPLNLPELDPGQGSGDPADKLTSVTIDAPDLCPMFTARVIRGVKVGPSPDWLAGRLEALGLRPINNVADITNYVMLELGQPLHAFDLNKLAEQRIVVRRAKRGEKFEAINHETYELRDDMLVIADAQRAVGIAGVMGGVDTEVTEATTDVLIEAARFIPLNIRRTARALKLSSDASFRFERGVDPLGVDQASRRAARLILDLAGGTLAPGVVSVGDTGAPNRPIALRLSRCNQLLGTELSLDEVAGMLDRLGLDPQRDAEAQALTCTPPSFRLDLHREVDLIEEVARCHGLANIDTHDKMPVVVRPVQNPVKADQAIREVLVAHGYHEAVTPSLIAESAGEPFLASREQGVALVDERRKAEPLLRPSLLPSLLLCRKRNQDVGNDGVKLFEVASSWTRPSGEKIDEQKTVTLLADAGEDIGLALRGLRGAVEELLETLAGHGVKLTLERTDASGYEAALAVRIDGESLGTAGLLEAGLTDAFDLQGRCVAAELDHPALVSLYPPHRAVGSLPRYPGIDRDLSVVVDESVTWAQVAGEVHAAEPEGLERLSFVGVYRGKPIEKGNKSVTLRMRFRNEQRTLRHEEVDPQVAAVTDRLKEHCGAQLRA